MKAEFLPFEAEAVLSIPLSTRSTEDTHFWQGTKNGTYSTKSAYRFLAEELGALKPGPSNTQAHKHFWQKLWTLDVPNKVRHFMWRACNESLPTKLNLYKRKVTSNPRCDLCHHEMEDTVHALWGCNRIKEIWWEEETCGTHLQENFSSFRDLFQGFLLHQCPMLAETFAVIVGSIWYNRNARRMGKTSLPTQKIYADVVERLSEFKKAHSPPLIRPQPPQHHPPHWIPPPAHTYKVNYDRATFQDIRMAGTGVVIRDFEGEVIAALQRESQCLRLW